MAELRSSNPALRNILGNRNAYAPPPTPGSPEYLQQMYQTQGRLTLDDVIVRTLTLMGLLGVGAALGWAAATRTSVSPFVLIALPGIAAFVMSMVINRAARPNVPLIVAFAAVEGFAIGALSNVYDYNYPGIVLQALIGTLAIFVGMLVLHRTGILRATPKMARIVTGALAGIIVLSLVDLLLRATTSVAVPLLNSASPLGILLSVGIVVIASLTFTLDFAVIEEGVARGVPADESWRMGFGLVVSFVWVYVELLRLLSKLQRR